MIVDKFLMILPESGFDRNGNLPPNLAPRFIYADQIDAERVAEERGIALGSPVYLLEAARVFIPGQYDAAGRIISVPRWVDLPTSERR
ncbi:MAG: hypothetical protein ABI171_01085 [Collimonas sp.]|uniref:hypothetical protein n=1 Tax=Collimonas sp. TaxID=1963772 RepID=UPI003264C717